MAGVFLALALTICSPGHSSPARGAWDVGFVGDYAYVTASSSDGLAVLDMSDPIRPVIAGYVEDSARLDRAKSVAIVGNYAYVAANAAFSVVDVSDPATPRIIGSVQDRFLNGSRSVAVVGQYAYVAALSGVALMVVDVSDPTLPTLAGATFIQHGKLAISRSSGAAAVAIDGDYAYVAAGVSIQVINISNRSKPQLVMLEDHGQGRLEQIGAVHSNVLWGASSVVIVGKYAYVAAIVSHSLTIVDVSDPIHPRIVGSVQNSTQLRAAASVAVAGSYAYITAYWGSALTVVNISDPASPRITGWAQDSLLNGSTSVAIRGSYAYVAAYHGAHGYSLLTIVNISDPSNPIIAGTTTSRSDREGGLTLVILARVGIILAIGCGCYGLQMCWALTFSTLKLKRQENAEESKEQC
ncbi:YIPF1 [Symbiodinium sp. KB8]|nr:YIPF1 [Symbiodinium sp. KB8]